MKKYVVIGVLLLILTFGFYLRAYHMDYPVIGYHNMKESHTLGEIYYGGFEDNLLANKLIYTIDLENPRAIHMDNYPILWQIIAPLWMAFGTELWIARLVIILFSLGCIVFTYLLAKELFNDEVALISAFLMAVLPLMVFFGRQVQYDVPALFFMLGAAYFFMRWRRTEKDFILFSTFFMFAGITKLPFMIMLLPIIAVFPYKKFKLKTHILDAIPLLFIPIFIWYSHYVQSLYSGHGMGAFVVSELPRLLTTDFRKAVYMYAVIDNFTTLGVVLAGLGLVVAIVKIKKPSYRFLVVWALSYVVYAAASPAQQTGHSYYQIPYAPLIAVLIALFIMLVVNSIGKFIKFKHKSVFVIGVMCVLMGFWWQPIHESINRQFDTQFFGLDIAGEYLNTHMLENETFMGSGHQSRGVNWHAKRRSFDFTTNVTMLQEREDALNITHLFLYQWGFWALRNQEMLDYIQQNYALAQMAFLVQGNSYNPLYTIFKRGGTYNHSQINSELADKPTFSAFYELTAGQVEVVVVTVIT